MSRGAAFLPLFAAVALALGLLMLAGRDTSRPISLCIGGCHTPGPPVPMAGAEPAIWHAKKVARRSMRLARTQKMDMEFPDTDASVMGMPYEDTPFSTTIASVPVQNPSRNWASLNNPMQGDP
ncbi:hypothetical protein T484DRAFT_1803295 [Baffinella frigidus]|nr:hypothetical protein T484DRAFT_1803295 [Cryptophyta sp. CCMP2293]